MFLDQVNDWRNFMCDLRKRYVAVALGIYMLTSWWWCEEPFCWCDVKHTSIYLSDVKTTKHIESDKMNDT